MAPVLLKRIVSVSSEDRDNPASNLLVSSSGGRWLCAPNNKSRTADVVVELCKRVRISSLELCNSGSAFVEVLVSDSDNPDNYVTLVHMRMLMTLQEARMGRNKSKVFTYNKDKLSSSAATKKWNRLKILCVQKYNREDQFGLRSISVFSEGHSSGESLLLSPSRHGMAAGSALSPSLTPNHTPRSRRELEKTKDHLHKLPSSSDPLLDSTKLASSRHTQDVLPTSTTPRKHPLRTRNTIGSEGSDHEEFEFSGLEKQSRLFRSCLKGSSETTGAGSDGQKPNKILSRISANKEKYRDNDELHYSRKSLLKRKLPKADLMRDFVDSYKEREKSDHSEVLGAFRIMSSHDNDYEIGEEPEKTWGWNKFKGKPKKRGDRSRKRAEVSGWISKRKKLTGMIGQCSEIFKKAGHEEVTKTVLEKEAVAEKETKELESDCEATSDTDSSDTIIYSPKETHTDTPIPPKAAAAASLVECPLCLAFYPHYAIEVHASLCSGEQDGQRTMASCGAPVFID